MKFSQPTLILDKNKCLNNIRNMALKAKKNMLIFRPHFKTHQSAEIGEWFRESGVKSIAVSSVNMAKYFESAGWNDITIAFPVNLLEADQINELATRISVNILVESEYAVQKLKKRIFNKTGVFIEIDTGYNRSGINYSKIKNIEGILRSISDSSKLIFRGFLTHSGHSYHAQSKDEIKKIHHDTLNKMYLLKDKFQADHRDLIISIGDTPCCGLMEDFGNIDEIRPGNFVFYDVMQYQLGACNLEEIAVLLVCPVVAIYPERGEIVIYGGAIHLSKDHVNYDQHKIFGYIADINNDGWKPLGKDSWVSSVSQEHGIVKMPVDMLRQYKRGDIIGVLPVHSCLTANLMGEYLLLDGKKIPGKLQW